MHGLGVKKHNVAWNPDIVCLFRRHPVHISIFLEIEERQTGIFPCHRHFELDLDLLVDLIYTTNGPKVHMKSDYRFSLVFCSS